MVEPSDAEMLLKLELESGKTALTAKQMQDFCKGSQDLYTMGQLRLIVEHEGEAVGAVDLFDYQPQHLRAGVGIALAVEMRGMGLAVAALKALSNYAQHTLHLRSLYAHTPLDNPASVASFTSAGFTRVGLMSDWVRREHGWVDAAVYQFIFPNLRDA